MSDPGFERTLRNALHTELALRLRHTLLHGLKGPIQTVLSALHLMQKKAMAGETQDLEKYAGWIKTAANDLVERAQHVVPPKPSSAGEQVAADVNAVTDDVAHLVRDEAALKNVELDVAETEEKIEVRAAPADLRLALQAIVFGVLDAVPPDTRTRMESRRADGKVEWTIEAAAGEKPGLAAFEARYDVAPPASGIAWHVAREIVRECGGVLSVEDTVPPAWRVRLSLPGV